MQTEITLQKEEIKKTANLIGFAYTAMFVFSIVIELILILFLFAFGMQRDELTTFFQNNTVLMLLQIFISGTMFTLPYIIIAKRSRKRLSTLIQFQKLEKGTLLPLIFIGLGVCKLAEYFAAVCGNVFSIFGITPKFSFSFTFETDFFSVVLVLLSVAVMPALVEEFAVRGVVLGMLRPYGENFAIIMSAVLFGCMHGNLVQIPFAFVVGLGLGFITIKSGSMLPAMIVHFINNLNSVLIEYLLEDKPLIFQNLFYVITGVLWVFLGLLGVFLLSKKEKDVFNPAESIENIPLRQKIGWVATTPGVIVAVLITVVKILTA